MTEFLFILVLLGSLQGLIMGSILFFTPNSGYANRVIAVLMGLIALPGLHLYLHHQDLFSGGFMDLMHACIPWVSVMALGPLIWIYVRSVLDTHFRPVFNASLLMPLVIDVFPKLVELLFFAGLVPGFFIANRSALLSFIDQYNLYADLPRWISLCYWIFRSYRYLQRYKLQAVAATPRQSRLIRGLESFIRLFRVFIFLWLIYLVPYLLPATSGILLSAVGWFPIYLPMVVMIYWMGIRGWQAIQPGTESTHTRSPSNFSEKLLADTVERLVHLMEHDKPWLDGALDVPAVARITGLAPKLISASVNHRLNKNFSQFINCYRVSEFKRLLDSPEGAALTIAGLAAKAGFSSAATFQRVFKQLEGQTPTDYLGRKAS